MLLYIKFISAFFFPRPSISSLTYFQPVSLSLTHKHTQVQLPGYLKALPLPKTFGGFVELTREQWLELIPFFLFLSVVLYLILSPCLNVLTSTKQRRPRVNHRQKLNEPKIADSFDMEDLGKKLKENKGKVSLCRCWKSNEV